MFQEGAAPVDETKTSSKLRRYRDTLSTSGLAIIVFGIFDSVAAESRNIALNRKQLDEAQRMLDAMKK